MGGITMTRRGFAALAAAGALTGCARSGEVFEEVGADVAQSNFVEGYGPVADGEYLLPGVPSEYLEGVNRRSLVAYTGDQAPGVIEIDPFAKFLFFVNEDGSAWRYPIAVGRAGKTLRSTTTIRRKEEWPGWQPTANMLRREPEVYGPFANGIPGGLASPLGARGLYLYSGSRDTFYRIHGTNDLGSIGNSGSAGCIRLFNQDIIDLYDRVPLGTRVVIRTYEDSVRIEGEAMANRGMELPPKIVSPETIYGALEDSAG
ncbi:L,D-transpeptidase [Defluviimonas sp. WL0050]|uniref:L,D-transpeptidase n=1 Tax=Albidovulum litorale TaxID=2984134 RepID=A0ABT2ZL46_9RHOB|nr:L,D-transpeptidase [Defluviimonas sp. WL0050]MCV2871854.1 L,D-transpeptidase [Defluviimonas sp. WL0050]